MDREPATASRNMRTIVQELAQWHRSWLAGQTFDQSAHQIVFQDYLEAVWTTQERRDQLVGRISTMAADWTTGPLVEALRGLRGLDLISAATSVAAIGDLARFESARHLMAYLGLVPSEQSSGERIRRGGITKTGNSEARRMLIEAAWSYRYPPRVANSRRLRSKGQGQIWQKIDLAAAHHSGSDFRWKGLLADQRDFRTRQKAPDDAGASVGRRSGRSVSRHDRVAPVEVVVDAGRDHINV
jgi:hypothetical protein